MLAKILLIWAVLGCGCSSHPRLRYTEDDKAELTREVLGDAPAPRELITLELSLRSKLSWMNVSHQTGSLTQIRGIALLLFSEDGVGIKYNAEAT